MQNRFAGRRARACLVVASLLALLCGVNARPAQAAPPPLKIAYSDWPGFLVWEVAAQKGYFKEAGVDVEMVWFEYGPCLDALAAGKVDAAAIVAGDALVTGAGGKPTTAIVMEDYSDGNDMIIGKPGIKSLRDLKGKKVALEQNLVEHLLLLKGLEDVGMSDQDVTIVNVSTNETPQTLASKGVDAVGAWYPISGQALKQVAGSTPLYTSANAPGLIYDALFVSRESLVLRKKDWKKVVGVWFKALDYVTDPKTHDDAVKIMSARVNVAPADYEKSMKGTHLLDREGNLKVFAKGDTLYSLYGSMKNANAFNLKYKVYKDSQDVDAYADPSLVKDVLKK